MHVTAYLVDPAEHAPGPMVALGGSSRFLVRGALDALRTEVLGSDADDELSESRFEGRDADLASVMDELKTISMWGDRRLVVVNDADDFVSNHRAGLEKYLDAPSKRSVLVLVCKTWRKNTRLHKSLLKVGLVLECDDLSGGQLTKWLGDAARDRFGKQLARDAAAQLVEFAGTDLGLLDQELGKLTAYVGERNRIDADDVRAVVGGWRAETTWAMLDAVQEGRLDVALAHLDKLLRANEAPQKILGGLIFVFRRLAHAVQLTGSRVPLRDALQKAGLRRSGDAANAERYLRRIGRARAERFLDRLVEADGAMKGGDKLPERIQLERLLLGLGATEIESQGAVVRGQRAR